MYISDRGQFFANRPETEDERVIYRYIRQIAQKASSQDAIEDFYRFLFQGNTHPEQAVRISLEAVLNTPEANRIVPYIINRCFYTIGNLWRIDQTRHSALRELISRLDNVPGQVPNDQTVKRLRQYVRAYVQSEELYRPLNRQLHLLETLTVQSDCLESYFTDYFFIHESGAVTRDIPVEYRNEIRQQRQQQAMILNQQLNNYWQASQISGQLRLPNPTRIPDVELKQTIQTFHPQRSGSYRQLARDFENDYARLEDMGSFRDSFHQYLMEPLVSADARYANNRFSHLVKDTMRPFGQDQAPLSDISITHMCSRLLQLFVSNTIDKPETAHFQNLIKQVGHRAVIAVLLKIVLFRRTVRAWFENRFGILFHIWESVKAEKIPWLIQAFEHANVALALNFEHLYYTPRLVR